MVSTSLVYWLHGFNLTILVPWFQHWFLPGGVISTFSWGGKFFFNFQCHRNIEKLEKQHFICSNLTLFIVPFFLFSLFSLFFSFLFFFLFFHFLGGDGPPAPSNDAPGSCILVPRFHSHHAYSLIVPVPHTSSMVPTPDFNDLLVLG